MKTNNEVAVALKKRLKEIENALGSNTTRIEALRLSARRSGDEALEVAIDSGRMLLEVKEIVGHGEWLPWLREHVGDISDDTARNYMKLANTEGVRNLNDAKTLTEAYKMLGILPSMPVRKALPAPAENHHIEVSATVMPQQTEPPLTVPENGAVNRGMPNCQAGERASLIDRGMQAMATATGHAPSPLPPRAGDVTVALVEEWLQTDTGRNWWIQCEIEMSDKVRLQSLTPASVTQWVLTPEGASWLKDFQKQHTTATLLPEQPKNDGKTIVVKVGPPLTLAHLDAAAKQLVKLIPTDADHAKFADVLSTYAAQQLVAAKKPRDAMSAYAR